LAVVEHLNVVEHIRSGFFTISVTYAINTFTFEDAKEALNNRVDAPIRCQAIDVGGSSVRRRFPLTVGKS